ncbi:KdsC family phosphatase [Leptospira sp. GIMC2001]|uniref:KdsC family phosphatase n=1 Tax=Leptospira sp. GIMC2001 TaxID=1513297 RepID=UPI00234B30EA|nr:HAD hydrolase family protein [Leptospira sp. GIMC2001]WCL51244.1 HAD hydrolase family protein [Leptospira sp. GIMC2001]
MLDIIKLLVIDVDGVLTDGKLYYTEEGESFKIFDVKDGLGIRIANKIISIAIISGNTSPIIAKRASVLGIKHLFLGIEDKALCLSSLCNQLQFSKEQVAYIGDDLNDLVVSELVGIFACPNDAHSAVIAKSNYQLKANGGDGAVREFIDAMLEAKGVKAEFDKGIKISNV